MGLRGGGWGTRSLLEGRCSEQGTVRNRKRRQLRVPAYGIYLPKSRGDPGPEPESGNQSRIRQWETNPGNGSETGRWNRKHLRRWPSRITPSFCDGSGSFLGLTARLVPRTLAGGITFIFVALSLSRRGLNYFGPRGAGAPVLASPD